MQKLKFHKISWEQLEKDCLQLAKKLKNIKIDKIVAISRGGVVWARVLSDLLTIKVSHITIESYQNLKAQKEPVITEFPHQTLKYNTVLVVDEVSDTGKTFLRALSYFKNHNIKKIYTLAPYIKSHTKPLPDFWLYKIDAWFIYPYELKETFDAFKKLFNENAKEKMLEVGFKKWEIEKINI